MKIQMNAHYGLLAHEKEIIYNQATSEIYDTGAVEIPDGLTVYFNRVYQPIFSDGKNRGWKANEIIFSRDNKIRWMWWDSDNTWHNVETPWIKGAQPNPKYVKIINERAGTDYEPWEMSDAMAYEYAPELFSQDDYYIGGEICDWL